MKRTLMGILYLDFFVKRGLVFLTCWIVMLPSACQTKADVTPTNSVTEYKLTRSVPYAEQSTDDTCWLACAAMVWGYYGTKTDEKTLGEKVKTITLNEHNAAHKATKRECLIALAQNGGLTEEVFHQAVDVTGDLARMGESLTNVPNQLASTNGTGSRKISLVSTNGNKSWLLGGGKLHFNPFKFAAGEIMEYTESADPNVIVSALKDQEPVVIVCRIGGWSKNEHAMVAIGATLSIPNPDDPKAKPEIISVDVLDPATGSKTPVSKKEEYLKTNLKAVYTKAIAEKILENERDSITKS